MMEELCVICVVEILWDEIVHRVPMMENAEIRQLINGPEAFTPDSGYLFGPAPEVSGFSAQTEQRKGRNNSTRMHSSRIRTKNAC